MKLLCFSVLVVASLLAPALPSAAAEDVCEPFEQVQTYEPDAGFYRAPAWYYETTVTIHYQGTRCASVGGHELTTRVEGTATVFGGSGTSAPTLETRPFTSTEVVATSNAAAFAGWWACSAPSARYTWTIADVYTFSAEGGEGRWSYRQTALTDPPRSLGSSFDSCSS